MSRGLLICEKKKSPKKGAERIYFYRMHGWRAENQELTLYTLNSTKTNMLHGKYTILDHIKPKMHTFGMCVHYLIYNAAND